MALGRNTKVVSQNSIAIGKGAHISGESQLYSVAIGVDSTTSKAKQVSFAIKKMTLIEMAVLLVTTCSAV